MRIVDEIERFSEDIDLALSYRFFAEILENNNQLKMLRKRCRKFVVEGYKPQDFSFLTAVRISTTRLRLSDALGLLNG